MLLALRHPRLWLASGWIMVVVAVIASIMPLTQMPKVGVSDKVEHVAAYAVLALWFAGIYPKSRYPLIGVALLVMGIVIEGLQGAMNLGRQADMRDVYANSLGIVSGLLLALIWLGGWAQRVESWTKKQ
jgi:VanZ family protein